MKSLLVKVGVILVVIGFAIFGYAEVWGADWKYYGESNDGKLFYNAESVTRPSEDIVRVWKKLVYSEKGKIDTADKFGKKEFEKLSETLILDEFHCGHNEHRLLSLSFNSKDGKVLYSANNSSGVWGFMFPGDKNEALYKILCK
jgi:hypothetical protein